MAAGYQDLFLEQGANFYTTLTLNDVYGNPYDLRGCVFASQGKKSYTSAKVYITFTTTIVDANTGTISLSANAVTTANVSATTLIYDVIMLDTSNTVSRVLEGRVFVDPGVTSINLV